MAAQWQSTCSCARCRREPVRAHADLDDAAGGALLAGVSRGAREGVVPRAVPHARRSRARSRCSRSTSSGSTRRSCSRDILITLPAMGIDVDVPRGGAEDRARRCARAADDRRAARARSRSRAAVRRWRRCGRSSARSPGRVPLIGFAGAPLTMLTYAVEGGGSQGLRAHEEAAVRRAGGRARAARQARAHLRGLPRGAGRGGRATCVQIFDSWGGIVSPGDFREYPLRYAKQVIEQLRHALSRGTCRSSTSSTAARRTSTTTRRAARTCSASTGGSGSTRCAGGSATAWRCRATSIRARCSRRPAEIRARVADILARAGARGHIFNLGHGVLPETDPEHVRAMVTAVRELSARA